MKYPFTAQMIVDEFRLIFLEKRDFNTRVKEAHERERRERRTVMWGELGKLLADHKEDLQAIIDKANSK